MTLPKLSHLALAGALGLALAACGERAGETDAEATGAAAGATTAEATPAAGNEATTFLADAMMGDNAEVRVGNLAAEKGESDAVKEFGRMLASEHGAHKTKVAAIATKMNVPETDATKPDATALFERLQGLSGAEFDQAFATGMVESHRKNIAMYEAQANGNGPADVKALAAETLPVLRKHLETAEGLQNAS